MSSTMATTTATTIAMTTVTAAASHTRSSVSVFSRSIGSGPRYGTASNRSRMHFANEKLPYLIQVSSKEEVMRARSGSWNTPSAALAIERHKHKSRQQATAEKVTIFDRNSSNSLTLQLSSYYLNKMRKYRESGQLPVDATRYSISPYVAAMVVTLATEQQLALVAECLSPGSVQ